MPVAVITGIGILAPGEGGTSPSFWSDLLSGRSQVTRLSRFDASSLPCGLAGEVDLEAVESLLPARIQRTTSRVSQFALVSADRALADAGLTGALAGVTTGVVIGTALGGWTDGEKQFATLTEKGAGRVNPFVVTGAGCHGPGIEIAAAFDFRGPQLTVSTGCPSGLQALALAASMVSSGEVDRCVACGCESPLSPTVIAALNRTEELAKTHDISHPCRPFDLRHDGLIPSEGACAFIVENLDHVLSRSARQYGRVLGATCSTDAKGMYNIEVSGETGARSVHRLLERLNITPDDIDYICANANGAPSFDRKETMVIRKAFGEFAARIPVSSIKGVIGHPFGAAGAFQVAATLMAMRNHLIPPTGNLETPDPECDLNLVMGSPQPAEIRNALVTSYGYGGSNAYLLLQSP